MNFQTIVCAIIVYITYLQSHYYNRGLKEWRRALSEYQAEQQRLQATILIERRYGLIVGTLMVSKDAGWLPTDVLFPNETAELRRQYGDRLGYCGKFGVISLFRHSMVSLRLFRQLALEWAPEVGVSVITMIVNPKHVGNYRALGGKVLARSEETVGLKHAPGVLMVLDLANSDRVQQRIARALRSKSSEPTQKVAA